MPNLRRLVISAALLVAAPAWAAPPSHSTLADPRLGGAVVHVRLRSPEAALAWARTFVPFQMEARDLFAFALGKDLAAAANPRAAIDALAVLDPDTGEQLARPLVAVAASFTSAEAALKALTTMGGKVTQRPGGYAVKVRLPAMRADDATCQLTPDKGPARLICGIAARDVELLAPLVLGPLEAAATGATDLHVELELGRAFDRYGGSLRGALNAGMMALFPRVQVDGARFDRAATDALHAFAEQLEASLADIDHLIADVTMGKDGAEVWGALRNRGKKSILSALTAPFSAEPAGAPALFWQLPADSASASWHAVKAAPLVGMRDTLLELADAWLEHEKVPAKDRGRVADLIKKNWGDHVQVMASGAAPVAAVAKKGATGVSWLKNALEGDWNVFGQDSAQGFAAADVKEFVSVWNLPSVQKGLKKAFTAIDWKVPSVKVVPAPAGAPPGTSDVVLSLLVPAALDPLDDKAEDPLKPAAKAKKKPPVAVTVHALVSPDGERGWAAFGRDPKYLLGRLASVRAGDKTLATRAGLEALKPGGLASGGFFSLVGLSAVMDSIVGGRKAGAPPASLASTMPHHGETPMVHFSQAAASGIEGTLRLPRATLEDALFMLVRVSEATEDKQTVEP